VKHLRVWQKLGLMGMAFMIPLGLVTWKMAASISEFRLDVAQRAVLGLEYYVPLRTLLSDLQQHRGMASAWLTGDASFEDRLAAKSKDVDRDLRAIEALDWQHGALSPISETWEALHSDCRALMSRVAGSSATESFELHTRLIDAAIALITDVADASKLTVDPDVDSHYLASIVIFQTPELGELLAQARGLGSRVAASRSLPPEHDARLDWLMFLAGHLHQKVDQSLGRVFESNPDLELRLAADREAGARAVHDADELVRELRAGHGAATTAADYFTAMTHSLDAISRVDEHLLAALKQRLHERLERFQGELLRISLWAFLGLLALSVTGYWIIRDITRPLGRVLEIANCMAAGDLATQVAIESRQDEFGVLAEACQRMAGNLMETVRQMKESGIHVDASMTRIAATSKEQKATADEIAATTTEIGATSREISATSRELVETMNEVAAVAEQTALLAGSGQTGLSRMEEAMRQAMDMAGSINARLAALGEQAGNINQVITTITKVADQTNLLSLNAAIEAQKAGQYGHGFAVVATEIRRLADQTAVATHDIEQMVNEIQSAVSAGVMGMAKFCEEVRRGMNDVQQASGQLTQIIEQVQALAPRFEAVHEGMQAQSTGAEQISQALTYLSDAAHQSVASLRESSQTIDQLSEVSSRLGSEISRFQLEAA
jgi:methyl-accepting chemotaxis protein